MKLSITSKNKVTHHLPGGRQSRYTSCALKISEVNSWVSSTVCVTCEACLHTIIAQAIHNIETANLQLAQGRKLASKERKPKVALIQYRESND